MVTLARPQLGPAQAMKLFAFGELSLNLNVLTRTCKANRGGNTAGYQAARNSRVGQMGLRWAAPYRQRHCREWWLNLFDINKNFIVRCGRRMKPL